MRIRFSETSIEEVSSIDASYYYHQDTPDDKQVYIQVTQPLSPLSYDSVLERDGMTLANELENQLYYYNMDEYDSFEEAWSNALERIDFAWKNGYIDLSDLISQWDWPLD